MARITIEDCLNRIPNRFELTLAASNRARLLSTGAQPMLDPARDKPTVIALREIAAGKVGVEMLHKQTANKVSLSEAFTGDSLFTAPAAPIAPVAPIEEEEEAAETVVESAAPLAEPIVSLGEALAAAVAASEAEAAAEAAGASEDDEEPEADENTP